MADDTIISNTRRSYDLGRVEEKDPVQFASRRTKGKDLPVKVKQFTDK